MCSLGKSSGSGKKLQFPDTPMTIFHYGYPSLIPPENPLLIYEKNAQLFLSFVLFI